jgi:hypothetical protein
MIQEEPHKLLPLKKSIGDKFPRPHGYTLPSSDYESEADQRFSGNTKHIRTNSSMMCDGKDIEQNPKRG